MLVSTDDLIDPSQFGRDQSQLAIDQRAGVEKRKPHTGILATRGKSRVVCPPTSTQELD
jgi:hypothetical protein